MGSKEFGLGAEGSGFKGHGLGLKVLGPALRLALNMEGYLSYLFNKVEVSDIMGPCRACRHFSLEGSICLRASCALTGVPFKLGFRRMHAPFTFDFAKQEPRQ